MLNRALRVLRTYHQLTQLELSKQLNISNSYLSEIESGAKSPSINILEKYSEIFKLPLSSIMLFSEELNGRASVGKKIRIKSTDKILRFLEWVDEKQKIT